MRLRVCGLWDTGHVITHCFKVYMDEHRVLVAIAAHKVSVLELRVYLHIKNRIQFAVYKSTSYFFVRKSLPVESLASPFATVQAADITRGRHSNTVKPTPCSQLRR
ncbi:hypothetical protein BaRGS_00037517 [Batillaria attramentaria]|uniref:Uncharacterized protein n=1 Tax=Batillaria attramentaria TaxID=370345 RepID=A0ABD0J8F1_9CAEN